MIKGKKILIGITGGIAAYKIPFLVSMLKKAGADVKIIFTPMAHKFVTPLTLSTLSGNPVLTDFFNAEICEWNSHIELGNWADLFLIAPATASTMGKMVNGIADNLLLATYLAAKCQVLIAPAMDMDMYKHPSVRKAESELKKFGHTIIEPKEGLLASGLSGIGRMEEPQEIFKIIQDLLKKKKDLINKIVLITAGPTYEAIDPVRFIGNRSSGLMGFSIANEMAERGAKVILISGPTPLTINHQNIELINVESTDEMKDAVIKNFSHTDIAILSAAVADYKPIEKSHQKIKKNNPLTEIKLIPTPDILAELGTLKTKKQLLIGFALETDNEIEHAKQKLKNKNLDFIVLNSLKDEGAGFKHLTNKITIIDKKLNIQVFDIKPKNEVAIDIVNKVIELL